MTPGMPRGVTGNPCTQTGVIISYDHTFGMIQPTSAPPTTFAKHYSWAPLVFYAGDILVAEDGPGGHILAVGDVVSFVAGFSPLGIAVATHVTLIQPSVPAGNFSILLGSPDQLITPEP
jgi:hypothetical protein